MSEGVRRQRVITPEAVKKAVRAIHFGHSLAANPLAGMAFIQSGRARDEFKMSVEKPETLLAHLIRVRVERRFSECRGELPCAPRDPEERDRLLQEDFAPGHEMRAAWSALYHYLAGLKNTQVEDKAQVPHSTLSRRLRLGHALLTDDLCALEASLEYEVAGETPARTLHDTPHEEYATSALAALLSAVRHDPSALALSVDQLVPVARAQPHTLTEYRLTRIATWALPNIRLDQRFVELTLLLDQGISGQGQRWVEHERRFESLHDVLHAVDDRALVLLGAPGSGKSTLLRHLDWTIASRGLRSDDPTVAFYVQLNRYGHSSDVSMPRDTWMWLDRTWTRRYPHLPPLADYAKDGHLTLLLDGLDEMPHASQHEYHARIGHWRAFLAELVDAHPGNRAVFSCRTLDYSAPLSSALLPVPHIQIVALDDAQIEHFLHAHCPDDAVAVWSHLTAAGQQDMYRTPYFLRLLVDQVNDTGRVPESHAALFTGFVRRTLHREVERGNPLFMSGELLQKQDCRQIVQQQWPAPFMLPERGPLIPLLVELAYEMQCAHQATGSRQACVPYREACRLLGQEHAEAIVDAAQALGLLELEVESAEVAFYHHLVQEYLAARRLARAPEPNLVKRQWRGDRISPSVAQVRASLAPAEPLPPLAQTGWEETTLLAAEMAKDADAFVSALLDANLTLAGRCANQANVQGRLGTAVVDRLRWALMRRSRDQTADVRDRIQAGLALGHVGDPRLGEHTGPLGRYMLAPLIEIPGGSYPIGEDQIFEFEETVWDAHVPGHRITLAGYRIGQFLVTNAEWACFMAAGGYDDERWWGSAAARSWRDGSRTADGDIFSMLYCHRMYRATPSLLDDDDQDIHATWAEDRRRRWQQEWYRCIALSEDEFLAELRTQYSSTRKTEPTMWRREAFNNPLQTVFGICWYEAQAYCSWLAHQSGLPFRLPTEVEWEAAARGRDGRPFPFGLMYDPLCANTVDMHLRSTTPIGVFPEGDTPEGVSDLSGNVMEWTSSAWGSSLETCAFPYPYCGDDGREAPDSPEIPCRILRGGAWDCPELNARTTFRGRSHVAMRCYGLRVAL